MAKRNYIGATVIEKEFIKTFNEAIYRHNPWTVWSDFVNMAASSIANSVDREKTRWNRREQSYLASAEKYNREELDNIVKLFSLTVEALEENPAQDFLGKLYMNLDFGSSWSGQFFTPYHLAEMMARMTCDESIFEHIQSRGFASVNDPACGAGVMLLAFADVCRNVWKINFQEDILFIGQDVDRVVAQMCYIQLSLLGCPGYVIVGNTLTAPPAGELLFPRETPETELWLTPMFFSQPWTIRRISADFKELFK